MKCKDCNKHNIVYLYCDVSHFVLVHDLYEIASLITRVQFFIIVAYNLFLAGQEIHSHHCCQCDLNLL